MKRSRYELGDGEPSPVLCFFGRGVRVVGTKLDRKGIMSIFRGPPGLRGRNLESQITELSDCFGTKNSYSIMLTKNSTNKTVNARTNVTCGHVRVTIVTVETQ